MKKTFILILILLVILAVALIINNKTAIAPEQENQNEILENNNQQENMQEDNNQTLENLEAQRGDLVSVHYTGKFENGNVFDSSISRGEPIQFMLGAGQVIKGWDEGLLGMKVGDKKVLEIAPENAYGSQDVTNPQTGEVIIPANSTLIFDVEMVNIIRPTAN